MDFLSNDSNTGLEDNIKAKEEELSRVKKKRKRKKKKGGNKKKLKKLSKIIKKLEKEIKHDRELNFSQNPKSENELQKMIIKESIKAAPQLLDALLKNLARSKSNKNSEK